MLKSKKKRTRRTPSESRRAFMKKAVLGAGAAAALGTAKAGLATINSSIVPYLNIAVAVGCRAMWAERCDWRWRY